MNRDIDDILISAEQIAVRLSTLAAEITDCYRDKPLTVICLSNGAIIFAADLIRQIPIPLQLDTISVSTYRGTESTGELTMNKGLTLCVKDRHVIIVDDILDTGFTLGNVTAEVKKASPLSVATCVLLNKKARRQVDVTADFCGFDIDDHFVIGYGLDYNESYRNLPYIGILKEEIYRD
jgi:hypoxanthine phosphoribosyltransferase